MAHIGIAGVTTQETLHSIITEELLSFIIREESTARLLGVVERLRQRGCNALILACNELPLCLSEANCHMPAIDTTRFLARRALERATG